MSFEGDEKEYKLTKFLKTNQSTCMNLRPMVRKGEKVIKGQTLVRRLRHRRTASWPSAATCWWLSCRGRATTSRMPS